LQPKLGILSLGDPQAQQLLVALQINTQRQEHRFDLDRPSISGFDVDAVQANGLPCQLPVNLAITITCQICNGWAS
jgi:hypothetical protein